MQCFKLRKHSNFQRLGVCGFLQDTKMSFVKSAQFLKMEIIIFLIFLSNNKDMEIHLRCWQIQLKNFNIAFTEFWSWLQTLHFSQVLNETSLITTWKLTKYGNEYRYVSIKFAISKYSCLFQQHLSTTYIKSYNLDAKLRYSISKWKASKIMLCLHLIQNIQF